MTFIKIESALMDTTCHKNAVFSLTSFHDVGLHLYLVPLFQLLRLVLKKEVKITYNINHSKQKDVDNLLLQRKV